MEISNKEILIERINGLIDKQVYTCLLVYSRGNIIYILKDFEEEIYVLIVPQAPLNENQRKEILKLGYKENFENINYEKYIDYSQLHELRNLAENIEFIFLEVFKIESDRKWRFELQTGMHVIKDKKTPLITISEKLKRNKVRKDRFKFLHNDFSYSIILFLILFLLIFREHALEFFTLKFIAIFYVISLFFVKIFKLKITPFGKRKFYGETFSDYFSLNGFKLKGDRYRGQIQGFPVEFLHSDYYFQVIIVYHKKIDWNRVLEMPKDNVFSSKKHDFTGMFYSRKMIGGVTSKEKVLIEAHSFVEYLKSLKIEKQGTEPII
ncbi:MAG: hypothetical protein ACOVO9_04330 [Bacteroidia bacterium]